MISPNATMGRNVTITKDVEDYRMVVGVNRDIGINKRGL